MDPIFGDFWDQNLDQFWVSILDQFLTVSKRRYQWGFLSEIDPKRRLKNDPNFDSKICKNEKKGHLNYFKFYQESMKLKDLIE